tara:strand:+ start:262 stop:897 length:636 start_codon:yes stop_codon:yes gene_type:complete
MNYSFLDDGYEIVRGAISKEIADLSYDYFKLKSKCVSHYYNNNHLDKDKDAWYWGGFGDNQVPSKNTYFTYGDFLFDTIMLKLHNLMEEKTNFYLFPTFSFARIYKNGNELKKHKDAEIAEISSTMNLGGDMYPIFITDPNKNEPVKIELNPGDMLIYKGEEFEHYREKFTGQECGQLHFHFVKANKDNLKYLFDGRPHMGLSRNTNESIK